MNHAVTHKSFNENQNLRKNGLYFHPHELRPNKTIQMDIYLILFVLTTLWVGPFWFAMLIQPAAEKTARLLEGPWFFLGPIAIWMVVMGLNPQGLIDFIHSGSHPDGFFAGLAAGMGTKAGITAMWAHMVAGDIAATRWIWKDSLKRKSRPWASGIAIFFGVMMMPVGILLHLLLRGKR
jgi:hypothetical protein